MFKPLIKYEGAIIMVKPVKIKLTKDQKERLIENDIVYGTVNV